MRWSATGHGQNVVQALMIMLAFMIMLGSSFKLVLQRYRECMYCLCCTLIDGYCGAESTIWCCMRIAIAGVKELCSGEIPSVCCQTCCTQLQQPHVLNTGVLLCHSVAAAALAWCIHSDWRVSTFQIVINLQLTLKLALTTMLHLMSWLYPGVYKHTTCHP